MEWLFCLLFLVGLYFYFRVYKWNYPVPHYKLASDTTEMLTLMIILEWKDSNPNSPDSDFEKYFKTLDMRAWSIEKGFAWKWSKGKEINNGVRKALLKKFETQPDSVLLENKEYVIKLVKIDEKIGTLDNTFNKVA